MATAKDILKTAVSQIGTAETPVNIVKYNTWYYGQKVKGDSYPWCAAFVSWVFNQNKILDLIKKSVSTRIMLDWFKSKKQTIESPKAGDLVFFNWSGGSIPNHVGVVEKVISKTVIQTIEGNTSDADYRNGGMVLRRQRNVKAVVGYGRPKYAEEPKATAKPATKKAMPTIRRGTKDKETTKVWQKIIGETVDGDFGAKTDAGTRKYQKKHGLTVDGIVGPKTWGKAGY